MLIFLTFGICDKRTVFVLTVFYKNYLSLCAKANKTPSAVASAIGLSNAAASGWKKGKEPSDTTLQKLANYFGVTVEALTNENKPALPQENELTKIQQKAISMILNMSEAQLKAFIAAAEAFLK